MSAINALPLESSNLRFEHLPPLALYVHLPWCVRKCPYCDFNSYEARGSLPDLAYVDALLRDLDAELTSALDRPLASIFLGGGTPSLFSGAAITRLLDGIRARAPLLHDAEITLEANPGAVEAARFAAFRDAGVNRLSIGIQSLRKPQLEALGRVHDGAEALHAVELARAAGFASFNVDLMYGLPAQDVDGALDDLTQVIALAPPHVSWYQLTLEPNTAFERRPPPLPADDLIDEMELRGRALLAAAGYARYEISAYARPGHRCTHNINYWEFGDYLGIGAGAHGKVTLPSEGLIVRRSKTRNPRTYQQRAGSPAACSEEPVTAPAQAALEFLMNALRLVDGVAVERFELHAGQSVATIAAPRAEAVRRGWLTAERDTLRATDLGRQFLNPLLALFC